MPRGIGKVQKDVLRQIGNWPEIGAPSDFIHTMLEHPAPSISRAITTLIARGLIVEFDDYHRQGRNLKCTSAGLLRYAKLIEEEDGI